MSRKVSSSIQKPVAVVDRTLDAWPHERSGGIGMSLGSTEEQGGVSICLHASLATAKIFHARLGAAISKVERRA